VIGKKGEDIEKLRGEVAKLLKMPLHDVRLNISEIRKPELDALLVAEGIAQQLERRVQFRSRDVAGPRRRACPSGRPKTSSRWVIPETEAPARSSRTR
jgi:hypothetical protein